MVRLSDEDVKQRFITPAIVETADWRSGQLFTGMPPRQVRSSLREGPVAGTRGGVLRYSKAPASSLISVLLKDESSVLNLTWGMRRGV